jgi:hypothetical protein
MSVALIAQLAVSRTIADLHFYRRIPLGNVFDRSRDLAHLCGL